MSAQLETESPRARTQGACRFGAYGALATIAGVIVSGPMAVALVETTHPQPAWNDAETFARSFHPIQTLPYLGGIVLIAGLVLLLSSLRELARGAHAALANAALVLCAAFAALVFLNYIVQATVVPGLASAYDAANGPLLAVFSMANPKSLGWALEMWGWGLLGVATWLMSPVFTGSALERAARWAFAANGPVSLAGTVWTVLDPGWELSTAGLVSVAAWNALLLAMAALALAALRRRARQPDTRPVNQ